MMDNRTLFEDENLINAQSCWKYECELFSNGSKEDKDKAMSMFRAQMSPRRVLWYGKTLLQEDPEVYKEGVYFVAEASRLKDEDIPNSWTVRACATEILADTLVQTLWDQKHIEMYGDVADVIEDIIQREQKRDILSFCQETKKRYIGIDGIIKAIKANSIPERAAGYFELGEILTQNLLLGNIKAYSKIYDKFLETYREASTIRYMGIIVLDRVMTKELIRFGKELYKEGMDHLHWCIHDSSKAIAKKAEEVFKSKRDLLKNSF